MPRTYMRYEPDDYFAQVNSQSGSVISHCGRFVISGCFDTVIVRHAQTNAIISKIPLNRDASISVIKLHPTLNQVALGLSDSSIRILQIDSQTELTSFQTEGRPSALEFSPDGSVLASGSASGYLQVFDLNDQIELKRPERVHQQLISAICFKQNLIITGGLDKLICVYKDLIRVQTIATIAGPVTSMIVSEDLLLVSTDDCLIRVFSFKQEQFVNIFSLETAGLKETLEQMNASAETHAPAQGTELVNISGEIERSQPTLKIFLTKNILTVISKKSFEIFQLRPESEIKSHQKQRITRTVKQRLERVQKQLQLQTVSENYQLEIQQLTNKIELLAFADLFKPIVVQPVQFVNNISCYLFANKPELVKFMYSCSTNYQICELNLKDNTLTQQTQLDSHPTACCVTTMNEQETVILTADKAFAKFWSIRTCSLLNTVSLPDNFGQPTNAIILKGGVYCIISSLSGLLVVLNLLSNEVESLQQLHDRNVVSMQIMNDALVSFGEEGHIKYHSFRMQDGNLSLILERDIDCKFGLTCGLASQDLVFLGCSDNQIRIHYQDTFKFKMCLYGHALPTIQLQLSPTNEKLFSIASDKTLRTWGLTFGECLKQIKLQEFPTQFQLVPGTHLCIITNKAGEIFYYDMDQYILIGRVQEGNYGKRLCRGHFQPIRSLKMASNGKFFVTAGQDGARTWIQSNDLMSVEDEANKRAQAEVQLGVAGGVAQDWGETMKGEKVDQLDKLQECVEECFQKMQANQKPVEEEEIQIDLKTASQAELMKAAIRAVEAQQKKPWQDQLVEFLLVKTPKSSLPELMRALPQQNAEQLRDLLVKLLAEGCGIEMIVWIYLRLIRTVFLKDAGAAEVASNVVRSLLQKAGACLGAIE
ncbi:WD40_repeat protein [Hexamita inflata]|uniref:WD40 repeat protein n=1 Tax=Hexamita inflata TaxID=28002 RepID=A0AA86Q9E5_9EUKA|nr:WD40 repeat protein [Hexamita inflata]